jgi:putative spermidine/putrescine transport system permease protein
MEGAGLGLGGQSLVDELTEPPVRIGRRVRRPRAWTMAIFILAGLFFLVPMIAAFKFALVQTSNGKYGLDNFTQVVDSSSIRGPLITSLEIAGITAVIVLVLMVPTVVWVRLKLPRLSLVMESVTILPIVIPPVVMAAGLIHLQGHSPSWMEGLFNSPITALTPFYVVLALPFTYRALDTGVRAIDLHTMVDAARNLGANWPTLLWRVILPNIQTAVLGAAFLAIAMVLGEVVIAEFLLYQTLPTEMVQLGQAQGGVSTALSLLTILFTFVLLLGLSFLGSRRSGPTGMKGVRFL